MEIRSASFLRPSAAVYFAWTLDSTFVTSGRESFCLRSISSEDFLSICSSVLFYAFSLFLVVFCWGFVCLDSELSATPAATAEADSSRRWRRRQIATTSSGRKMNSVQSPRRTESAEIQTAPTETAIHKHPKKKKELPARARNNPIKILRSP